MVFHKFHTLCKNFVQKFIEKTCKATKSAVERYDLCMKVTVFKSNRNLNK